MVVFRKLYIISRSGMLIIVFLIYLKVGLQYIFNMLWYLPKATSLKMLLDVTIKPEQCTPTSYW